MSFGDDCKDAPVPSIEDIEKQRRLELILGAASTLGVEDLRVLELVAEKLRQEQRGGGLVMARADVDFADMAVEEAADALAYVGCALVRSRRR